MSTTTTAPEWLNDSPGYAYNLTACDSTGGFAAQDVELTLEEYDALKQHLAKLRGVVADTEATAQSPSDSKEANDLTIDPKKPGALTLTRLVKIHRDSIGILECEIQCLTEIVNGGTLQKNYLLGRALDAEVLSDVLQIWNSGGYEDEYPEDGRLLATMKERCTL